MDGKVKITQDVLGSLVNVALVVDVGQEKSMNGDPEHLGVRSSYTDYLTNRLVAECKSGEWPEFSHDFNVRKRAKSDGPDVNCPGRDLLEMDGLSAGMLNQCCVNEAESQSDRNDNTHVESVVNQVGIVTK